MIKPHTYTLTLKHYLYTIFIGVSVFANVSFADVSVDVYSKNLYAALSSDEETVLTEPKKTLSTSQGEITNCIQYLSAVKKGIRPKQPYNGIL